MERLPGADARAVFVATGLFAVLAMGWWELYLGVHYTGGFVTAIPFAMAPHEWHGHELVFGFGSAALAGGLLAAVPGRAGAAAARAGLVALAAALWLAGRLALWLSAGLPAGLVALVDLAFLPVLWGMAARRLPHRPVPGKPVFALLLTLFWLANLATHLGWAGYWSAGEVTGPRAGIMVLAAMLLVNGGLVSDGRALGVPAPPRTALHTAPSLLSPAMDGLAVLLPLGALLLPDTLPAALLALAAGLAQLLGLWRRSPGSARARPVLAALHLSAAMSGLGLVLIGLAPFTGLSEVGALHLLAIGGVGGMTLAAMARSAHGLADGRCGGPAAAPRAAALASALLPVAALLRWLGSELSGAVYFPAVLAAGLVWIVAFGLFAGALLAALPEPAGR